MIETLSLLLDASNTEIIKTIEQGFEAIQKVDGWNWFGRIADVIGVISFIISIPTLIFAKTAKKAIQEHDDIKEYKDEIDEHIDSLVGLYESMEKDEIYNRSILTALQKELDTLTIQYTSVIKPFKNKINKLLGKIKTALINIDTDKTYNKSNVTRLLNQVIEHLKKVKKSI